MTGKGVMATLLHLMVDRGLIDLEAPVAKYWPEFGKNGKGSITVRQAASHRAGLYSIARVIDSAEEMFDWDHMVRVVEDMWPVHKPDADFGYHAWTGGWVIGEVLQRVTGKRFPDLVKEYLADPLDLDGLALGGAEHDRDARGTLVVAHARQRRDAPRRERPVVVGDRVVAPRRLGVAHEDEVATHHPSVAHR